MTLIEVSGDSSGRGGRGEDRAVTERQGQSFEGEIQMNREQETQQVSDPRPYISIVASERQSTVNHWMGIVGLVVCDKHSPIRIGSIQI